jgi:hypothetical protein
VSLRTRKLIIIAAITAVILLANIWAIAGWLDNVGVVSWARNLRSEYVTGAAITVIVAMLILPGPSARRVIIRRCPVCGHVLLRRGRYCGACGSRVSE